MPKPQRSFTSELVRRLVIEVLVRHALPHLWRWAALHLDAPALLSRVLDWF